MVNAVKPVLSHLDLFSQMFQDNGAHPNTNSIPLSRTHILEWKSRYRIKEGAEQMAGYAFCDLWAKLNRAGEPKKAYNSLIPYWSSSPSVCPGWNRYRNSSLQSSLLFKHYFCSFLVNSFEYFHDYMMRRFMHYHFRFCGLIDPHWIYITAHD